MASEIKIELHVTKDNTAAFKRALERIVQDQVEVGVPQAKAQRKKGEKINNAALAYIHNTGSPARNIPARPFMEPGIKDAQESIAERLKQIAKAALDGSFAGVDRGLNAVGLLAQSAIKRRIDSNIPPPLAPGTLRARARRGVRRTKTLVDTGELRNSITYVIERSKRKLK